MSNNTIVDLQRLLNDTARDIPFATVAAMKSGWRPGFQHRLSKILTMGLVLFSILIMVVVARLTLVHNEGRGLIVQAELLVEDKPQQTIDRLIREHVQARLQLEERVRASAADLPLDDAVTMAAIEANEIELRDITGEVSLLRSHIGDFSANTAPFPLLGMKQSFCFLGSLLNLNTVMFQGHCPREAGLQNNALDVSKLPQLSGHCHMQLLASDLSSDLNAMDRWNTILSYEKLALECNGTIASTNYNGVEFNDQLSEIKAQIGHYAIWLLPALYGAMGAVMYHMRWVLDPLLPHPSIFKLLHRIVLGALAGIVLGWFYAPGTALEQAATSTGFSLFILAFVVGFSLDVFFAILDRFVSYGERSVRGAVDNRQKDAPFMDKARKAEAAQSVMGQIKDAQNPV